MKCLKCREEGADFDCGFCRKCFIAIGGNPEWWDAGNPKPEEENESGGDAI